MKTARDYTLVGLAGCIAIRLAAALVEPLMPLLMLLAASLMVASWLTRRE